MLQNFLDHINPTSKPHVAAVRKREKFYAVLLALVIVVAAVLRFAQLGEFEFWLDEACSICTITAPGGILADLRLDNNPPLYFFLLKGWTSIFGITESGARSLSVVLSLAQIILLSFWIRRIGLPVPAAIAAAFIASLAPLHWYYSREARPYILLLVCITGALWSAAAATHRGNRGFWLLHGLFVVAGLHTHELFIPFIPVLWIQTLLLRPWRRSLLPLAVTHALAALAYVPWMLRVLSQPKSEALGWVVGVWNATPPSLALAKTFEAFTIGGMLPRYLRQPSFGQAVRWIGVAFFALLVLLSLLKLLTGKSRRRRSQIIIPFAAFVLPLAAIYAYSWIRQPIYVVGRYDVIALPGFYALAGFGAFWLWRLLARYVRMFAVIVPVTIALLATACFYPLFEHQATGPYANFQTQRGQVLAKEVRPGDVIVCIGLEGAKVAVQMLRHKIAGDMITFPLDTRQHFGWLHPRHMRPDAQPHLAAEANKVMSMVGPQRTYRRAWLLTDPLRAMNPANVDPFAQELLAATHTWAIRMVPQKDPIHRLGIRLVE